MSQDRFDPRPVVDCSTRPSRTRQSHKESCDINYIVRQYRRTGLVTHLSQGVPRYGDVSEAGDFREVMQRVRDAQEWFLGLPAKVRSHFANDVAAFMDAQADPSRAKELEALGLKPEPAVVAPVVPEPVHT